MRRGGALVITQKGGREGKKEISSVLNLKAPNIEVGSTSVSSDVEVENSNFKFSKEILKNGKEKIWLGLNQWNQ